MGWAGTKVRLMRARAHVVPNFFFFCLGLARHMCHAHTCRVVGHA